MSKISNTIRAYIDGFLQQHAPGTGLPAGPEIARITDTSATTVQRILKEYGDKGMVIRIPGRGSFIPGKEEELPPVRTRIQTRHSAESIAEMLYRQISDGTFKTGDLLPSIKYLTMDWHVSRSTAVAAYRMLRERGCVHKLGRGYVTGSPRELAPARPERTLHFFYGTHPKAMGNFFHAHAFAFAYRVLEHEMGKHNYRAAFHRIDEFDHMAEEWIRTNRFPSTVILAYMKNQDAYDALQPRLKRLLEMGGEKRPGILVGGKITRRKLGGVTYMNSGHLATEAYRELARYAARKRIKRIVLCYDEKRNDHLNLTFQSTLNLWTEVRHRCRDTDMTFHVHPPDDLADTPRQYLDLKLKKKYAGEVKSILGKYRPGSPEDIYRNTRFHRNLTAAFRRAQADEMWVFPHDITAIEALDYWERKGMDLPMVFGMENDVRFLYRGLSACVPDHATLGYLMAQALLKTHPVPKSSRGYLRAPVLMLHRETTVAD